ITEGGNLRDTLGESVYEWLLHYTNTSATVPLVWETFTAMKVKQQTRLDWKVSEEVNVKAFIVEKSADSRHFLPLATIPFSSANGGRYTYTDASPFAAETYYRVKEVDEDGQYAFSPVRKTAMEQSPADRVLLFPNPAGEVLNITFFPATARELV